ncbi:MAG: LysR family transcriptional regulator [Gammaproteobacteria bacterium]
MDLWRLESYVAVVEEGSIRGGARRVRVAQPALSQSIRKLERQFGATLLVRSHRGIEMTEAGERVFEYARGVLAQTERVVHEVTRMSASADLARSHALAAG